MTRQFIACRFNPWDRRTYTYHNDGEPVAVGDSVVVETWRGNATVEVMECDVLPPAFETKAIVGPAPTNEGNPEQ
jgi:hypothetical protein